MELTEDSNQLFEDVEVSKENDAVLIKAEAYNDTLKIAMEEKGSTKKVETKKKDLYTKEQPVQEPIEKIEMSHINSELERQAALLDKHLEEYAKIKENVKLEENYAGLFEMFDKFCGR